MIAWPPPARATSARDVKPGESWAFRDHRTQAQMLRDEAIDNARAAEALAAHRARLAQTSNRACA